MINGTRYVILGLVAFPPQWGGIQGGVVAF
jgi:hypothetical protein